MTSRRHIARMLAMAWCAGPWARDDLRVTAEALLGAGRRRAIGRLVDDVLAVVPTPYAPPFETLARFIGPLPSFEAATAAARSAGLDGPTLAPAPAFRPLPPFADLPVPRLVSPADLAEWLGLLPPELDWFADTRRQHGVTEKRPLQHYSYAWVPKRRGAPRLIEAPKPRLKALQRQILRDILDRIPVHEAAHGFVKGRSCLGGAARHGGEAVVATLDLADFFPSVPLERVHGIFRCLGYPTAVARLLTGLCSTTTPRGVLAAAPGVKRPPGAFVPEAAPHLPQGAPTSPALANLSANRLDARLDQLAEYAGARYTRYADDLAFSGDDEFAAGIGSFLATVEEIIRAERFAPNRRKTRIMRRDGRQQVTGLVVNQHLNVPRPDYDRLKAILHNCARHGPAGQNRDGHPDFRAHLDGRVGWVQTVNPHRGLKLRLLFEAIAW